VLIGDAHEVKIVTYGYKGSYVPVDGLVRIFHPLGPTASSYPLPKWQDELEYLGHTVTLARVPLVQAKFSFLGLDGGSFTKLVEDSIYDDAVPRPGGMVQTGLLRGDTFS